MSAPIRAVGAKERRIRLGRRHRLAAKARAGSPEEVADSLVAVHATDPATVYLSIGARLASPELAEVDRALYERDSLVRMHGMRRTAFVVPSGAVPVVHAASTRAVAARQRTLLLDLLGQGGYDRHWLAEVEAGVLAALRAHGEATAAELAVHEPRLRTRVAVAGNRPQPAAFAVATRLLTVLAMDGHVVRRRPRGSWISSQFRWAIAPPLPAVPVEEARRELVRRWLAANGPGTEADLRWWTGWPVTQVRRALAALDAQPVALDEGPGFLLADDVGAVDGEEPWAALLPALDSTPMGWRHRHWYLPAELVPALFDGNGNVGPTVWWNGRVVGGWTLRAGGEVVWRLLADPGAEAVAAIEAEAARLASWVGGTAVTPRFRTPLERELAEGRA